MATEQKRPYDSTVARIAGNIAGPLFIARGSDASYELVVSDSIELAIRIVNKLKMMQRVEEEEQA